MARSLKGSGRTTRLLERARCLADLGLAVYVVAADGMSMRDLRKRCSDQSIKFETPTTIRLDWETMTVPGMHPNCVVLVDHWAIESRFGKMIEEYHRYDPPPKTKKERTERQEGTK